MLNQGTEASKDSGLVTTTALCWEATGLRLKLKEQLT